MDDAADPIAPLDAESVQIDNRFGHWPQGCRLLKCAVRSVLVLMGFVLAQHLQQVPLIPDQRPIKQFASATADPSFHDRIGARCLHRPSNRSDPGSGKHRVPCRGELRVAIAQQKGRCLFRSCRSISRVYAC